jgi:hypothetical protein
MGDPGGRPYTDQMRTLKKAVTAMIIHLWDKKGQKIVKKVLAIFYSLCYND